MATIQLDTCYNERNETIEGVIADFSVAFGITGKVVNPAGPAGDWPIVEWEGQREQLKQLVKAHYSAIGPNATDEERESDAEEVLGSVR
jgi:hypothetical protein